VADYIIRQPTSFGFKAEHNLKANLRGAVNVFPKLANKLNFNAVRAFQAFPDPLFRRR